MTYTGPAAYSYAVNGLRLNLHFPEIQQRELEFVTLSRHGRRRLGSALLADGCLSGRTTAGHLYTSCAHESLRAKHAVTCATCAYVLPLDGRSLGTCSEKYSEI
jgi:hypothetical protein